MENVFSYRACKSYFDITEIKRENKNLSSENKLDSKTS